MARKSEPLSRRAFLAASAAPPERPPNLLVILADQWRAQTLTAAGDTDLLAPNLHRLAGEGLHFRRAYASYPLCTPSRSSLITGRFPHASRTVRNSVQLPLEEPSLAAQLKSAGYATGYIGKWHLDGDARPGFVPPGPRRRGFDYWAAFNRGHSYTDSTYFRDTPEPIRPGGFEPDYQTSLAVDFIRANRARPFFLFLSWGPPHTPRTPPPRFARLYDPRRFHLRENVPADYAGQARRGHAGYYGLCSALDENVGRLLRTVDEEGIVQDTIVVFTSDHGDLLGSHGLEYKNEPFEESARVPFLLRFPRRLKGGATNDLLVSNVDFAPTLLSFCGAAIPAPVQGRDLSGLILSGRGERPESVYAEGKMGGEGEWRMIVRGLDKMVINRSMEVTHLFNLGQDPYEKENLAREPGERRKRDELLALLRAWAFRTGDRIGR